MLSVVHPHGMGPIAEAFLALAAMWLLMMTLMMAPAAWPWVRTFDKMRTPGGTPLGRLWSIGIFVTGYLVAWSLYSIAAALLQLLVRARVLDGEGGMAAMAGAGVLVIAGMFQFAPLKRACLTHCRNPLTYFLTRWRHGPIGGFRMGLGHGMYCVGCCWALMATAAVTGLMNLWWMVLLTAAVVIEQAVPRGDRVRAPLGLALIVGGLLRTGFLSP